MQKTKPCPNYNHGRPNAPVRFCPACGDVVNDEIPLKTCTNEKHAIAQRERSTYCIDCGKKLAK